MRERRYELDCELCGNPFWATRRDASTCSAACRAMRSRQNRGVLADLEVGKVCANPGCGKVFHTVHGRRTCSAKCRVALHRRCARARVYLRGQMYSVPLRPFFPMRLLKP